MTSERPWHASFAAAAVEAKEHISIHELKEKMSGKRTANDFVVVDLRRTDFENGAIRGAINLPAHSFFPTREGIVSVLSAYKEVIFHCNACTPGSRGARCANWYQEALDQSGITQSKAVILDGGIRAWLAEFGNDDSVTVKIPAFA